MLGTDSTSHRSAHLGFQYWSATQSPRKLCCSPPLFERLFWCCSSVLSTTLVHCSWKLHVPMSFGGVIIHPPLYCRCCQEEGGGIIHSPLSSNTAAGSLSAPLANEYPATQIWITANLVIGTANYLMVFTLISQKCRSLICSDCFYALQNYA